MKISPDLTKTYEISKLKAQISNSYLLFFKNILKGIFVSVYTLYVRRKSLLNENEIFEEFRKIFSLFFPELPL